MRLECVAILLHPAMMLRSNNLTTKYLYFLHHVPGRKRCSGSIGSTGGKVLCREVDPTNGSLLVRWQVQLVGSIARGRASQCWFDGCQDPKIPGQIQ